MTKRLVRITTPPGQIASSYDVHITVDGKPLDGVVEVVIDPIRVGTLITATLKMYVELDMTVQDND